MERNLHVVLPDNTTIGKLLGRYEEEISPTHKSHKVEKYRLHLADGYKNLKVENLVRGLGKVSV
jgi:hypothetical protein